MSQCSSAFAIVLMAVYAQNEVYAAVQGVKTAGLRLRLVDAKEQVVGRLASQLSVILQVA